MHSHFVKEPNVQGPGQPHFQHLFFGLFPSVVVTRTLLIFTLDSSIKVL